jgi:hypothetical protein
MALTSTDRWKILSNIVAQMGTDKVDLHAELAKAENMINIMDTQKAIRVSQSVTPNLTSQNATSNIPPMSTDIGQSPQELLPPQQ